MPPPARGCLRSEGPVPGGQAGVAGGTLPRQTQEGGTLSCHTKKEAGWHEATCHPRLGGACEARALCREGRRGSPGAPWAATRRKMVPGLPGPGRDVTGQDRTGQDGTGQDRTGPHGTDGAATHKKKRVARMSHPLEKRQLPTLPTGVSVPSAWTGLTSLFGMGRGGSPAL